MRFRRLQVQARTSDGPYGVSLDFPDGLVVVWADNSMGKSTCVKSIIVALGLEAMLTPNQNDLPLPPALKSRLDSATGEHQVLESEVYLEIENNKGERITVQRTIKGSRDKNLITVHAGPALSSPNETFTERDFFVNRAGSASRDSGFHFFLADFLGWELPAVKTYDGREYPLYLQCLAPYFIVEQTRGWSTVQPPLPTQFRLRDAHKRAVEFLLDLDAHRIAAKRQAIQYEIARIETEWMAQAVSAGELAKNVTARIQSLPLKPVTNWPPVVLPGLTVLAGDKWIDVPSRGRINQATLDELIGTEIPRVIDVATSVQSELNAAEEEVHDRQTTLARLLDLSEMETMEFSRISKRLSAIDEDIQHHKDVRTLRGLGSRQNSSIDHGNCPICHQTVPDSLVPLEAGLTVMSLDESVEFLTEQHRTYEIVLANAAKAGEARQIQIRSLREELGSLREHVRALKQTLMTDGRVPSIAAIRTRIELETTIKKDMEVQQRFDKLLQKFAELSENWRQVQIDLMELPRADVSERDQMKLGVWTNLVQQQLKEYGFGSFSSDQVVISQDTYKPEHEGFDLEASFSLQNSISASDLIRTIWSYLNGILELSRKAETQHPGCILFDEPRQQSTRDVSFAHLLKRTSNSAQFGQQVIFFTSENQARLMGHLDGLPHKLISIEGRVLKKLTSAH